jgi:hypothetical protein
MQSDSQGECGMSSMNTHQVLIKNLGASSGSTDPDPTAPDPTAPDPTPGADQEPPQVQILSPGDGARVNPSLVLRSTISDNKGVTKAEVVVDGSVVTSRSGAPFEFNLSLANGQHTIKLVGYDAAGNQGSDSVTVIADASQPQTPTEPEPTNPTPVKPTPGTFGATCKLGSDCASGLCGEDSALSGKFCTETCTPSKNTCPSGAGCFASTGAQYVCGAPVAKNPVSPLDGSGDLLVGGCNIARSNELGDPALLFTIATFLLGINRRRKQS